jgi:hypothetical protein
MAGFYEHGVFSGCIMVPMPNRSDGRSEMKCSPVSPGLGVGRKANNVTSENIMLRNITMISRLKENRHLPCKGQGSERKVSNYVACLF